MSEPTPNDEPLVQMNRALRQTYRAETGQEMPPSLLRALTDAGEAVALRYGNREWGIGYRVGQKMAARGMTDL